MCKRHYYQVVGAATRTIPTNMKMMRRRLKMTRMRRRKTGRRRGRLLALAPVRRAQERRQKRRSRVLR
jgi:hypothetical protein